MPSFIDRFRPSISGVLSGFDRLLFRGNLRSLMYPSGMLCYLRDRKVLFKDFVEWSKAKTEAVKERFSADAAKAGHEVMYIRSPSASKEELAREVQMKRGVAVGVVGSFSCVEPCRVWTISRDRAAKKLVPAIEPGQCLHLYRYVDHHRFGFLHVRLQTWFPFSIQVCMNGREFLRRQFDQHDIGYEMRDNCFTKISDWRRAQELANRMLEQDWVTVLDALAKLVFPDRKLVVGQLDYQWSTWQSEWATDVAFQSVDALAAIYPSLVRHALLTSDTAAVLRFLGHPVTASGAAVGPLKAEVTTRRARRELARRREGTCIKHHVGRNSVKMYDKQGSVLRIETTLNDTTPFKVYRTSQGSRNTSKEWLPLRKSVADISRRAEISQGINNRYLAHQAVASTDQPLGQMTDQLAKPVHWHGERLRGLDLTSKDRHLIDFLADPALGVIGFKNADLRQHLRTSGKATGKSERQISGMATRLFRHLRAHGLIKKVPKSHRYQLTDLGKIVVSAVKTALAASTEKLARLAA